MAVDQGWTPLAVPFAMEVADRARRERYIDPDFYRLEADQLWSRTWQVACRLEELPDVHDFVEYEILDQSVLVVRTGDDEVRAMQNACRHRGVRVAQGRGTCESGFTCPFHGWCYGPDGTNTFVSKPRSFAEHNLQPGDIDLTPVRCEVWGGMVWINLDDDAPPLRTCIEPLSLTRYPADEQRPPPEPPEVWECDDPRLPPIPAQDFSNLPKQQLGIHARSFEYLRLSAQAEGGVANFERTVDGFLAGLPYEQLLAALRAINVNPLEQPIADLGF